MKNIAFALLTACTASAATAQQKLNIEQATVFLSGAELTSTARVSLQKGETEIKFSNVAGNVNRESIIVNATNDVLVESVTFQNDYLDTTNVSQKVKALTDSIEMVDAQRQQLRNNMLAEQVAVIQANRKISGDNTGLSVAEMQKMLDFINSKMEGLLNLKYKEEVAIKKVRDHLARLKLQLAEEQKKDRQPGGLLSVKFYAHAATTSNIAISYELPDAGWSPTYDVMTTDTHSPLKFFYKANIHQTSGVQWNNVHLTLSTGNPDEGMQPPTLTPWYLAFENNNYVRRRGEEVLTDRNTMVWAKSKSLEAEADSAAPALMAVTNNTSIDNYVAVDNHGVNTTFDIDLPYTIPADGQQHLVAVKKYELPATYRYLTIPKLDKDAFLQAQVTNWEDLNLLEGPTNIFLEGAYIGQGSIDPANIKDTMYISMGRDKKIVVKKERDRNLRSVKTIGTNIRETFAYNITLRNTRKEAVSVTVMDQQPVSNDKDIVIEDKEASGADLDETTGLMKWAITLAPNETRKLTFGYTVKYPRGKTVTDLK